MTRTPAFLLDGPSAHEAILTGFTFPVFRQAAKHLDLPESRLATLIGLSATAYRQLRTGARARLTPNQSDRLWMQGRVFTRATDTLGSKPAAVWLDTPHLVLNGGTPREFSQTSSGLRLVETLLKHHSPDQS